MEESYQEIRKKKLPTLKAFFKNGAKFENQDARKIIQANMASGYY
jgi:hypothetical protein